MAKIRVNWTLEPQAYNILSKIAKHQKISRSRIIENLIMQKLADPIIFLKSQKRELIKEINKIDEQVKDLEDFKKSA